MLRSKSRKARQAITINQKCELSREILCYMPSIMISAIRLQNSVKLNPYNPFLKETHKDKITNVVSSNTNILI